jgi:hypothetical protein
VIISCYITDDVDELSLFLNLSSEEKLEVGNYLICEIQDEGKTMDFDTIQTLYEVPDEKFIEQEEVF